MNPKLREIGFYKKLLKVFDERKENDENDDNNTKEKNKKIKK